MKAGDMVVLYVGGAEAKHFIGTAILANEPYPAASEDRALLRNLGIDFLNWAVDLKETRTWKSPKPIKQLLPKLSYVKDKKNYGLFLRQGVRTISERDYKTIVA